MENNAAPSTLVRDTDGKTLMSLEELKEGMFQSIRDSGTLELIRAQLRRRFIEKLQQQRRLNDDRDQENNAGQANRDASSSTPDEKLVHGLVAEYLASKGLENTLAVFVPEIGGSRNQVDSGTILEMLHVSSGIQKKLETERAHTGQSLLLVLVRELVRRFQLATMDSGTQTAMDCFDHRIVLENQLRRVENSYLAECAAQKLDPLKSLEERMVQYQREYDDICDKRLEEEVERYKSTEIALVRAEERKRFDREVDNLRASLFQEYQNKQQRLQERERELELAFVARRTELETSLFETRQSLFKDMERLRVKEAELQVKVESDFRHFASETQRFQLWEESVRTQEANLEGIIAQTMREKDRGWAIERQQALADIQNKQDELADREKALTLETGTLKTLKTQVLALQQEVAALEAALSKSGDDVRSAQSSALQLEKDRQRFEEKVAELERQLGEQKSSLDSANTTNARLAADRSLVNDELSRFKQKNADVKEQMKLAAAEVKSLQQQILDIKLDEANVIVAERKKYMQSMDEERERSQWKENELVAKVRELQSRLAEFEALAEKYQSQYEDEKVHVESLRHNVSSLNSLLTQAQATINVKHGAPRDFETFRTLRGVGGNDFYDTGAHVAPDNQLRGVSERTFMMKMMEMMANFQDGRAIQRNETRLAKDRGNTTEHSRGAPDITVRQDGVPQPATALPIPQPRDEDEEEARRLKEAQARIERELNEQREYEKKKHARMEEQEREMAEQHRLFEEKLARVRRERIEEEERIEEQRKRKQTEEEAKLQEEVARQRTAVQEAEELQQKLAEVAEQQRLQEEEACKERRLDEERKFNEEIEATRCQQNLEDELATKQKQKGEAEEERVKQELKAYGERERIRLEQEQVAALQAPEQKREIQDRQREEQLRLAAGENKPKEDKADRIKTEAAFEGTSWQGSSVENVEAKSNHDEAKIDAVIDDVAVFEPTATVKTEEDSTTKVSAENDEASGDESEPRTVTVDNGQDGDDTVSEILLMTLEPPLVTTEKEEPERQTTAEESKKKEDENVIDVYRQRVFARKAAEKQRQQELDAEKEQKAKKEEERQRLELLGDASDSDQELELSGGSFAESSAASNSDSF